MARGPILYREKQVENRNGRYRDSDWNIVNTELGAMWEPVYKGANESGQEVDPDDCINRIDHVNYGFDRRDPFYRDSSGMALIGGHLSFGTQHAFRDE